MTETDLLQQLKAGAPSAVATWYKTFSPKIRQWVTGKTVTVADAEEITQDVFLSCLKHLPLFRGESSILTWMLRIAHHEVADYYRKRYAKKFIAALPLSEFLPIHAVANAEEVSSRVMEVLQHMQQEHREILLMKYLDRKKVRQIAMETGRSIKSVESILFRAREEFRELYVVEGSPS